MYVYLVVLKLWFSRCPRIWIDPPSGSFSEFVPIIPFLNKRFFPSSFPFKEAYWLYKTMYASRPGLRGRPGPRLSLPSMRAFDEGRLRRASQLFASMLRGRGFGRVRWKKIKRTFYHKDLEKKRNFILFVKIYLWKGSREGFLQLRWMKLFEDFFDQTEITFSTKILWSVNPLSQSRRAPAAPEIRAAPAVWATTPGVRFVDAPKTIFTWVDIKFEDNH